MGLFLDFISLLSKVHSPYCKGFFLKTVEGVDIMINTFFKPKDNVTRIPTAENFAHYVDNSIYQMKQHLNTSRLLIIGLLISQLVTGIILAGLINFVINEPAENYFQDGNIVLAPLEIIGGKDARVIK